MSEKSPVLHIIDSLKAGGAERMAVNLANGLLTTRFQPHFCVTRQLGPVDHLDPTVSFLHLARRNRFDLRAFYHCIRYVRQNGIRIIHAHSTSVFFALLVAVFFRNIIVIWHVHGIEIEKVTVFKRFFYGLAARYANGVICVSSKLTEWIFGLRHKSGVWYLPNYIQISPTLRQAGGDNLVAHGAKKVICVSNLRHPKDHLTLLYAWRMVLQVCPDAHLLLIGAIGEQDYMDKILKTLDDKVFVGRVTWLGQRSDVPDLLGECQIGVLSSLSEGFPVTLLEYGWAGLGVVATEVGECAEILDSGKAGMLINPGDVDALANALIRLLQDAELRQALGDNLKRRVQNTYSQDIVLTRLTEIYNQLLSESEKA